MFKSISDFKAAAEFFPAGRIIPQRIIKSQRKHKSVIVFGSNSWALPTEKGYIVASDTNNRGCCIRILSGIRNAKLIGSPYTKKGETHWIGSSNNDGKCQIDFINDILAISKK